MSKEKVFHDSYLDIDSREQGYWEWFEKMHNEHPTPEEVQAFRLAYKIAEENKK